ncbi:uncharacterized protein DSM5745_08586 [Aspergillus mulundensis]|uniref:Amine oxidase domain-containing protein n=1 Tax=Aspergillus mulundensis TaxID=1810919 RepID=A0A3D8R4C3_9EURO|nr:hypothetical protein DSM5745_08586 [Aspergillus mulundensis]RDW68826.1 hypothetical protein DSM5745_08586 [Aspergillus mulundensis]
MSLPSKTIKGTVAIVGGGPAGLIAAWALVNDGYDVTVFEKHDQLTLARHATLTQDSHTSTFDIPMRPFSTGYDANLLQLLNHLKVKTQIHRFLYTFWTTHNTNFEPKRYFSFFSNFHRILPCLLLNKLILNVLVFVWYIWFTLCVFLIPPRARGVNNNQTKTETETEPETLAQYARRIHLPDVFLDWYLLPLFASLLAWSHADLRACPAVYIADYRKRTLGAHHRTIADMRGFQDLLVAGIKRKLSAEVFSVHSQTRGGIRKVCVLSGRVGGRRHKHIRSPRSRFFDHVVVATDAKQAGRLCPPIRGITDILNEGRVCVTVATAALEECYPRRSEPLGLVTLADPAGGYVTRLTYTTGPVEVPGVNVTVRPFSGTRINQLALGKERKVMEVFLTRPLPTAKSHDLLLDVFSRDDRTQPIVTGQSGKKEKAQAHWKNGDGGIWLAGGYAFAGLPLFEACVRSGLEAAEGIGATIPFEIVRRTPF